MIRAVLGWRSRVGPLRERDFRILFGARSLASIGASMTPIAITFAVLAGLGSAAALGAVLAGGTLVEIVLVLVGGTSSDRIPRRTVVIVSDVTRALALLCTGALLLTRHGSIWELAIAYAAVGASTAFFHPAMTGLLPETVSSQHLQAANALRGLYVSLSSVIGPALAGLAVALGSPGWAVLGAGVTYAISSILLLRMNAGRTPAAAPSPVLQQLRAGWKEFSARSWLWSVVGQASLWHMIVWAPFFVAGPVLVLAHLGGASTWAWMQSLGGVGAILGSIVGLRVRPRRPLVVGLVGTLGFVPVLVGLSAQAPVAVVLIMSPLIGLGPALFAVIWDTSIQRDVPSHVLSQVSSYDYFGSVAILPIGYAVAGPLVLAIGPRAMLWGAAVAALLLPLANLMVRGVRQFGATPIAVVSDPGTS
ncbi:MAG: MFS transporter [Candidatus Dormibacteria bacterium]